jgi:hypothetical protein
MNAQEQARIEAAFQITDVEVAELAALRSVDLRVVALRADEGYVEHIDQQDSTLARRRDLAQQSFCRCRTFARASWGIPVACLADNLGDVVENERVARIVTPFSSPTFETLTRSIRSGMLMIRVIGGALLTGHSAWPIRNWAFALDDSGWNEVTSLPKGSFSSTGRQRRAKSFMPTTRNSRSRCTKPISKRSSRQSQEPGAGWASA